MASTPEAHLPRVPEALALLNHALIQSPLSSQTLKPKHRTEPRMGLVWDMASG